MPIKKYVTDVYTKYGLIVNTQNAKYLECTKIKGKALGRTDYKFAFTENRVNPINM